MIHHEQRTVICNEAAYYMVYIMHGASRKCFMRFKTLHEVVCHETAPAHPSVFTRGAHDNSHEVHAMECHVAHERLNVTERIVLTSLS